MTVPILRNSKSKKMELAKSTTCECPAFKEPKFDSKCKHLCAVLLSAKEKEAAREEKQRLRKETKKREAIPVHENEDEDPHRIPDTQGFLISNLVGRCPQP